jgi:hypothetical protein
VTGDIELPASQPLDVPRPDRQPTAEEKMRTTIIKSVAVSVPVAIGVFVGINALAVRNQQPDWNAWLGMAVGIGVLAGVFFGLLAGFMRTSHLSSDWHAAPRRQLIGALMIPSRLLRVIEPE